LSQLGQASVISILHGVAVLNISNEIDCDLADDWFANLHILIKKSEKESEWMLDFKLRIAVLEA
jgi:hypothetical protein